MRIGSFRVENFRNLRLAECKDVPNFMVICGSNGCGKSALLEALKIVKESAWPYVEDRPKFDSSVVRSNSDEAVIEMEICFSKAEKTFAKIHSWENCPENVKIQVKINKDGGSSSRIVSVSPTSRDMIDRASELITSYYSAENSPGFFDYVGPYRQTEKGKVIQWDAKSMSDSSIRKTLNSDVNKFQLTKQYLIGCKLRDLQKLTASYDAGHSEYDDSLKYIKNLFSSFFAPMRFVDVVISDTTFEFIISTPNGNIGIDDLSSGEKELLNMFVRFQQLSPKEAVILFDEADAHLHPYLERKYLEELRKLSEGNQLLLTTHSPEMMVAAGSESLYTLLKEPSSDKENQLCRVTNNDEMLKALSDLMGSRGIVSFNRRIVFIEGEDASADREIYERAYPPDKYNISFMPAGNSSTVRKTAEQVNALLTSSTGFQQYFSIIDKDIERLEPDPTSGKRLFRLPVYHVENLLLDANSIFETTRSLKLSNCPYKDHIEVLDELKQLVLSETHLNSYAKALRDARYAKIAKEVIDAIYQGKALPEDSDIPKFSEFQKEARIMLQSALTDDTWIAKCKGRDLLKAYCKKNDIRYKDLRNLLISKIDAPPRGLEGIMSQIYVTSFHPHLFFLPHLFRCLRLL